MKTSEKLTCKMLVVFNLKTPSTPAINQFIVSLILDPRTTSNQNHNGNNNGTAVDDERQQKTDQNTPHKGTDQEETRFSCLGSHRDSGKPSICLGYNAIVILNIF